MIKLTRSFLKRDLKNNLISHLTTHAQLLITDVERQQIQNVKLLTTSFLDFKKLLRKIDLIVKAFSKTLTNTEANWFHKKYLDKY